MSISITPASHTATDHRRVWAALALWCAVSVPFAASGALAALPRPVIPLLIWSPVVVGVVAWRRSPAVRAFVDDLDLRLPVLFHLVRVFFGVAFLVEMQAGRLPAAFALVAGPGDIVAGGLALPAALIARRTDRASRGLLLAWNLLGLVDILAVFLSAQRLLLVLGDPRMLQVFQRLPYSALPVLVVPLVILTHLVVFARLRRAPAATVR
jgi:hypothetical protein